jgi:hypothetical protein
MAALIAVGLLLVHVADQNGKKVSKDDALAIARGEIDFKPSGYQIRFLRRGVPPRGYWITSYYVRKPRGGYSRITVVVIDAGSGKVTEVHRET